MDREVYQEIILEHFRQPRRKELLKEGDAQVETLRNPNCGDIVKVKIEVADNGDLECIHDAQGCAASVASTSIMCEHLSGLNASNARTFVQSFLARLEDSEGTDHLGVDDIEIEALLFFKNVPARKLCVSLAWACSQKALAKLTAEP